jgi:hypothetical protein
LVSALRTSISPMAKQPYEAARGAQARRRLGTDRGPAASGEGAGATEAEVELMTSTVGARTCDYRVRVKALRGREVGVAYAVLVLLVVVAVFAQPNGVAGRIVINSSTNLQNLRAKPLDVLVLSAFVLESPWSLWILPVLVVVFGAVQRWLGMAATVLVAAFGHVFATLFVALLINTGLAHHQLSRRIADEPDVGVSYGLAALLGLLTFRLGSRWRPRVVVAGTAVLLLVLVVSQTFTDLGHLVAWTIGVSTGLVGSRMAAASTHA